MASRLLRTLIVDDEPIARRILLEELQTFPGVEVVGEASNGKEALTMIAALQPGLVFLDLQMPVMSGFEVIQNLSGDCPPVIAIVTAFDQHTIRAFEAGAIDYLLKPVSAARLGIAVERARGLLQRPIDLAGDLARITAAAETASPAQPHKIVGRLGEEYHLLDSADVRRSIMAFETT